MRRDRATWVRSGTSSACATRNETERTPDEPHPPHGEILPMFRLTLLALFLFLPATLQAQPPAKGPPKLELVVQTGRASYLLDAAFTPNGKFLVTGSFDGTAILWETASGKQ